MTVAGNFTINNGNSLNFSGAGELDISGNWTKLGSFTPGAGTVTFSGSNPSSVNYNGTVADITNYTRSTFTKGMLHLSDSIIGPAGDNASMDVPIGFTFNYLGTNYTQARICTNGWLSFTLSGTSATNEILFNTSTPNLILAPWWDDLKDDAISFLSYNTTGSTPNRIFTAEWHRVLSYSTSGVTSRVTFQVKLFESTNVIEFHYGNPNGGTHGAEGASIGIEDPTGGSNHFIEATTGSTTAGVTNLVSNVNWPTVNYRFTPPVATENFNNLKINKTGGSEVSFNCNVIVGDSLIVSPGGTIKINNPRTITVNGY